MASSSRSLSLPFGLTLSLSKGEAAARPVDASSFDKLSMRRLRSRRLPLAALACLSFATTVSAQPQLIHRETLQARDVPAPTWRSQLMRVSIDKGGLVARHTHPGLEIGYIEQGDAQVKIKGRPDQALKRGDSFAVLADTPHSVQNTGPGELVILSTYVVDKSKPLATPAP